MELVAATSDELWMVRTIDPPFQSRGEAWRRPDALLGLMIHRPGTSLHPVSIGDELIDTVRRFCDRADRQR